MLQIPVPLALPPAYLLSAGMSATRLAVEGILAIACAGISVLVFYLVYRKPDLPSRPAFALVAAFLLAGGFAHLLGAAGLGIWDTPVGVVVAALAVAAAIAAIPASHKAFSLRSPMELERAQRLIEEQIAERRRAEERLVVAAGFPTKNPYPLVETDLAGKPVYLNPAAQQQFPDLQEAGAEHPVLQGLASLARSFRWGEQESVGRDVAHGAAVFRQKICYLEKRDHLLICMVDITDLQQAQESLRKNEEEYRALFEEAPVACQEYDPDGTVWLANRSLCMLLGCRSEDLVGKPVWQVVAPEQRDACREYMLKRSSGREPLVPYVVECVRKDRTRILLEVYENFIRSPQGMIVGLRCALVDVTDRSRKQEEAQQAQAAAEQSARDRSEFTAGVSNRVRASLDEMIGEADRALRNGLTPEQTRNVAALRAAAAATLSLVSDVHDFCEIEAGTLELQPVEFSLREGIGETVTAMALRAREKGLELAYRVAPEVPDRLTGDLRRLQQILLRLLANAVQFTSQGEVVLDVETGTMVRKGELGLHFRVTDTGIGISREDQARIFNAFRQAPSATLRQQGGAGLGLAISARLVERLGGRLWFDSEPKKGSAFHFTTLLGCSEAMTERTFPPRVEEFERLPALVVERHPTTRRILEEMLESWGMKVQTADSAQSAVAAMTQAASRAAPFRLALLDALLPDGGGLALVQQIWKHNELDDPKVLMLVSEGQPEEEAHYLESGVDDCVAKPVRYHRLWSAIAGAFGKSAPAAAPVRPLQSEKPLAEPAESPEAARERAARAERMAARIVAAARAVKTTPA